MLEQLAPLLAIGGIFSVYAIMQAVRHLWDEYMIMSAEELSDYLKPTEDQ